MVGQSLIHRSDPLTWPRATISVTLGALLSRLVRPIRERIWWYVRVEVVGWPVFEHCAAALTPQNDKWLRKRDRGIIRPH